MRVLVTGGGCEEPIDGVRFVANFSTGRTAARIAETLLAAGHDVTLIAGRRALLPQRPAWGGSLEVVKFGSFADLDAALGLALGPDAKPFALVVHAAAVSDYSVDAVVANGVSTAPGAGGKIDSSGGITVKLRPNPKLVDTLRDRATVKPLAVVAFKLTNGAAEAERLEAVAQLMNRSGVEYVVSNDLAEISGERHPFRAYANRATGRPVPFAEGETLDELARFVLALTGGVTPERPE